MTASHPIGRPRSHSTRPWELPGNFIRIALLKGVITDSYFGRRDRMGRMLVFLARLVHAGKAHPASGIGMDEGHSRSANWRSSSFAIRTASWKTS
jgi:cyanophycinase-like exopeptidase